MAPERHPPPAPPLQEGVKTGDRVSPPWKGGSGGGWTASRHHARHLALALALLLSGCGSLPQPFFGAPGHNAQRLVKPPPPRLAVPMPTDILLPDAQARALAAAIADNLTAREVPAIAAPVQRGDWALLITAAQKGNAIVPTYAVRNPAGEDQGSTDGKPVTIADWGAGRPDMLLQAASDAGPPVADMLTQIQARLQQADPNSLYNRPARVFVPAVTGAPGDGDQSLAKQMRSHLAQLGPSVQDKSDDADFVVQGLVRAVPIAGRQVRIEIQWVVSTPEGKEHGRVVQLNEVPAGTLDGYWGEIAVAIATEAASGVKDVILTQSGRR